MKEKWKNVVNYEQTYQVSDSGKVKRIRSGPGAQVGRILSQYARGRNNKKYLCVHLSQNGLKKQHNVHRLVLEAFVSLCPSNMECRHLDGNECNNKLNNLKWGTSQENAKDAIGHKTVALGTNLPQAKLNNSKIHKIKQLYATEKWSCRQLAKKFNVSHCTIWKIITKKIWRHIR